MKPEEKKSRVAQHADLIQQRDQNLNARALETLQKASEHCTDIRSRAAAVLADASQTLKLPMDDMCFVAIGSVGRDEALAASDLDLVPVCRDEKTLNEYRPLDRELRATLMSGLGLKVSRGSDLTKCHSVADLVDPEAIGGSKDDSASLTRRILILTEGVSIAGGLQIRQIRSNILSAYSENERTRGRHVLSMCNDLARFYRTLCIEYKAKVDVENKDWCTRNLKLRHSRKLWYYSTLVATASLANRHPDGEEKYTEGLLDIFELPPVLRLFRGTSRDSWRVAGKIINRFAWFLAFMAKQDRRDALAKIRHTTRYSLDMDNPFPMMKLNSDMLHQDMVYMLTMLDDHARQRVYDWFLL